MEKNPNTQTDLLDITEDQKKKLIESLILEGTCEYTFKLLDKIPVVFRSITFREQEDLSRAIGDISEDIPGQISAGDGDTAKVSTRKITVHEFNNQVTALTLKAYVKSINGKPFNVEKLATQVVRKLADKLRAFLNTIDEVLTSPEEIKN